MLAELDFEVLAADLQFLERSLRVVGLPALELELAALLVEQLVHLVDFELLALQLGLLEPELVLERLGVGADLNQTLLQLVKRKERVLQAFREQVVVLVDLGVRELGLQEGDLRSPLLEECVGLPQLSCLEGELLLLGVQLILEAGELLVPGELKVVWV